MIINPDESNIEFNSRGDIISDFTDEMEVMFNEKDEDILEIAFNSSYLVELIGNIESQNLRMYLKSYLRVEMEF